MKTDTAKKVTTLSDLLPIAQKLKAEGKTIVTTNGCFDIAHAGHVDSLEWAANQGDVLIVGLNSDHSVKENKGDQRPVLPEGERARMLAAFASVDYVFIFNQKSPTDWIKELKPDIHVKGPGSDKSAAFEGEKKIIESCGGKVLLAPLTFNRSTTSIIERVIAIYPQG